MVLVMPEMTPEDVKAQMKLAIKEWLNEKFADLGKWSLGGIMVAGLGGIAYFMIWVNGYHK